MTVSVNAVEQYPLFGATAYVGFDEALEARPDYFLVDGVDDDVEINAAIVYAAAQVWHRVVIRGDFNTISEIVVRSHMELEIIGSITAAGAINALHVAGEEGDRWGIITIKGGKIIGDETVGSFGILVEYADAVYLENMWFSYFDYNIHFLYCYANCVLNNLSSDHGTSETTHGGALYLNNCNTILILNGYYTETAHASNATCWIRYCAVIKFYGVTFEAAKEDTISIMNDTIHVHFLSCYFEGHGRYGIIITASIHIVVDTCYFWVTVGILRHIRVLSGSWHEFKSNHFQGGATTASISIASGASDCIVHPNQYSLDAAILEDDGVNTHLATISGEFSRFGGGSAGQTDPVINTSPGGIDIDANDEFVFVDIPLKTEIQQIVRIKIWAYSNIVEADHMRLRIVAHGATGSEQWNLNPIDVPDHPSEDDTLAIGDVVRWMIDVGDDAQIGTLAAQDLVELLAVGEAAGDGDSLTNALFGGWNIEYV